MVGIGSWLGLPSELNYNYMLNPIIKKLSRPTRSLLFRQEYSIGIGKLILHYIRTVMNKIRWEENRELRSLQTRNSNLPRNVEQANKLFIATEQDISLSEKARMQRIDQILGTNTHYQDVKVYQERLDSDHIMDLEELRKVHKEETRKTLNWLNPKADVKIRYKNKKKYYSYISRLRTYPRHEARNYDFADETNENTINFLGKEAVYSKISLKPVQLTIESMQKEAIGSSPERPFESQRYYYFRPLFTMQLFRIQKKLYKSQMITDEKVFLSIQDYVQEIISLDQIYEILKEYDLDERVSEYLKKVENNRLEYLFSEFTYDRQENVIAIMIDLLGTKKEYCLLVKNLSQGQNSELQPRAIFNIRPQAVFSGDGKSICYVQRSPEGGWIELAYRPIESCWKKKGDLARIDEENQEQILYRCAAEKELVLGTDSNKNYIFLTIQEYNQQFSESLFVIDKREEGSLQLIELDKGLKCKYYYDVSPLGIIIAKFAQIDSSYLKYGKNTKLATSIQLIPYKQHIQLHHSQKIGISDGLLPFSQGTNTVIPPTEFDVGSKKTIYKTGEHQFITEIETRSTHLIIVLNLESTYNKAILYFLPFKLNSHPHSIILSGGTQIHLRSNNFTYNSQVVEFSKPYGFFFTEKVYNIWKKQLSNGCEDLNRYHHQKLVINEQGDNPVEVNLLCQSVYKQSKDLPVLIYFPSRNEEVEGVALRQFLEKGVMVVEFRGRGTFSHDLQHYLSGSKQNFPKMLDDLQEVIEFIGNNMTKNISLYCKGQVSSLVGLWFNVYFPYLFNATVLHNGLYDLEDASSMSKFKDFFGSIEEPQSQNQTSWAAFNIFKHNFKKVVKQDEKTQGRLIGTLENLIISSDKDHRIHSRKLTHRLRQNTEFRYDEVYLKEYENEYETDLSNFSYLYTKMRTRMQSDINDPELNQEEQSAEEKQ